MTASPFCSRKWQRRSDAYRARLRERWWSTHYGQWLYGYGRTHGLAALRAAAVVVDTLTRRRTDRHAHRVDRALRRAAVRDYAARRWLPFDAVSDDIPF